MATSIWFERLRLVSILVSGIWLSSGACVQARSPDDQVDCGVWALCALLRTDGQSAELASLIDALPPPNAAGRSMKELQDEARLRGVVMRGMRLSPLDRPNGPAIVYFRKTEHGHFVLMRPVGHTGRLVQILDFNALPEVMDYEVFAARPGWTGLALVRDVPNDALKLTAVAAGLAAAFGGIFVTHRLRRAGNRVNAPSR